MGIIKKNIVIIIFLVIMWIWIMVFFYLKADEVTKDPCAICAEKMGEKVICVVGDVYQSKRVYNPNGSVENIPASVPRKRIIDVGNISFEGLTP